MTKLHLGVIDIPHSGGKGNLTTGDLAEILEAKYHIYQTFYERHQSEIIGALERSLQDFLEDRLSGSPANAVSFAGGEAAIKALFSRFIDSEEMNGLPGVPTAAARAGVSHRRKHPYAKRNPPRPSFRDTGEFEDAFRAWVEE